MSATSRAKRDNSVADQAGGAFVAADARRDCFLRIGLKRSLSSGPSTLWISFDDTEA
jgi:hypothetical protein